MTLNQWITKIGGPNKVARLLNVTPHAVRYWRRGLHTPTGRAAILILQFSNYKVGTKSFTAKRKKR